MNFYLHLDMKSILALIQLEFKMEMRRKYAIGGALLYVLSTVFVIYTSLQSAENLPWNALFWLVALFIAVNAIAKSFAIEQDGTQLYLYQLASGIHIILAKMIYNVLLVLVLLLLSMGAFLLFLAIPIQHLGLFVGTVALGSLGLGIVLTFISAIANKTDNSAVFTAILSFPILLPTLLSLIKLTHASFSIESIPISQDIVILLAIDTILIGLILILFPIVWKD